MQVGKTILVIAGLVGGGVTSLWARDFLTLRLYRVIPLGETGSKLVFVGLGLLSFLGAGLWLLRLVTGLRSCTITLTDSHLELPGTWSTKLQRIPLDRVIGLDEYGTTDKVARVRVAGGRVLSIHQDKLPTGVYESFIASLRERMSKRRGRARPGGPA